jgi:hypothetical protein
MARPSNVRTCRDPVDHTDDRTLREDDSFVCACAGSRQYDRPVAIADGDPRIVVPDFLSKMTWIERNTAIRFFTLRHESSGKNYPPDEAPASVARRAMVLGGYGTWFGLAVIPCVLLILWSAVAGMDELLLLGLDALFIAGGLGLGAARHRQINRYFDENFPGSLDFRNGTAGA